MSVCYWNKHSLCLGISIVAFMVSGGIGAGENVVFNPSFNSISESQISKYNYYQEHGFCDKVLSIERTALVVARPDFHDKFGEGVELSRKDRAWLLGYALGARRCRALKTLAKVLAIPKLKGETKHYAAFAPTPRLGDFVHDGSDDVKQLIDDRRNRTNINSPVDWAADPMSLKDELALHVSYTELVKLAVCHRFPHAFKDLGSFYDQQFALLDPYLLYGILSLAIDLKIDTALMKQRLVRTARVFSPFERVRLSQSREAGTLLAQPKMKRLKSLCRVAAD